MPVRIVTLLLSVLCLLGAATGEEALDPRLAEVNPLLQELEQTGNRFQNVPREHGRFLRTLIEMTKAQNAVEIGTSNGYSGIWLALGLEQTEGKLTTIEIDEGRHELAKANFAKAGLDDIVTCVLGDALQVLPTLEGTYDFVFMDAVKTDYWRYFEMLRPKLSDGAVVVAHNAVNQRNQMDRYFELVESDPSLQTTVIAVAPRDGMAITFVRTAKAAE